jgi:hypothetical protein
MNWGGWATFGFGATVALTAILVAAQLAGRTRMDIPMMLGTILVEDPDRARVVGSLMHLVNGHSSLCFTRPGSRCSTTPPGGWEDCLAYCTGPLRSP